MGAVVGCASCPMRWQCRSAEVIHFVPCGSLTFGKSEAWVISDTGDTSVRGWQPEPLCGCPKVADLSTEGTPSRACRFPGYTFPMLHTNSWWEDMPLARCGGVAPNSPTVPELPFCLIPPSWFICPVFPERMLPILSFLKYEKQSWGDGTGGKVLTLPPLET